jgi:hypothetical protein
MAERWFRVTARGFRRHWLGVPMVRGVMRCIIWLGVDGLHKTMPISHVKMALGVYQTSYKSI